MTNLRTAFVLLIVLLGSAGVARADYPADMSRAHWWRATGYSGLGYTSTAQAMCDTIYPLLSANEKAYAPTGLLYYYSPGYSPDKYCKGSSAYSFKNPVAEAPQQCPYGGTYTATGNMCIGGTPPPPVCPAGEKTTLTYEVTATAAGASSGPPIKGGSDGQCEVTLVAVKECYTTAAKKTYCTYGAATTGTGKASSTNAPLPATYTPSTTDTRANMPPTPAPAGSKCPAGSVQGGVDSSGTTICFGTGTAPRNPVGTSQTTAPTVTQANPDGSTTDTTTTTQKNADGSTTTTTVKKTTDASGTVTISADSQTSVKPSTGEAGKQDTPEDKNDLCARNPMLSICRSSSVAGTCGSISCEGDAIQCATLRAAASMECAQKQDKADLAASPLAALGNAAVAGNDPLGSSIPSVGNGALFTAPSSLDNSGWLGGGNCFADKSIVVQGHTITLPLSKSCDALLVLRYALMVVASLVSFRIVSGAVLT